MLYFLYCMQFNLLSVHFKFQIKEGRGGVIVTYASPLQASLAAKELHGKKKEAEKFLRIACIDFAPPVLATGHKPGIFVVTDLPDGKTTILFYSWMIFKLSDLNTSVT